MRGTETILTSARVVLNYERRLFIGVDMETSFFYINIFEL